MDVKMFWADSRGKVIAVLVFLWLGVLVFQFRAVFVIGVLFAVVASVTFDSLIIWFRTKARVVSLSSIVTGLLIGLVLDPFAGFVGTLTACMIASLSKAYLGRGDHQHIFNPAALSIVVSSLLFRRPVAWWAASWGGVPVIIVSVGMLPILWKLRRLVSPMMFLAVFFLTNLFYGSAQSALRLTMDGTVFLFAFVMLPEPRTAPTQGKWRWGWGPLVGLLVVAQNLLSVAAPDPLLVALLVANILAFSSKKSLDFKTVTV